MKSFESDTTFLESIYVLHVPTHMFHGVFAVYITLPTKLPKPGDSVGIYVIQPGCVSFDIADCQSGPPHPSILKS